MDTTPVIVAARRTPIGSAGHAFAAIDVSDLAAVALAAVTTDLPDDARIDDVILGVARGPGGNPARVAALAAGLPVSVPGVSVDRQCGSGQEAIHLAADRVRAGSATVVLAGGAESASTAPPGRARFAPAGFPDPDMGPAAADLAHLRAIARNRQDAYAERSHRLARLAVDAGYFADEIVPVGESTRDERPKVRSLATLARMPAVFGDTVTAGNSCGISDGAAVVAVVPEWFRARHDLAGLSVRAWCAAGVDPALPGLGPVPAIRSVLTRSGLSLDEVGLIEITEAFAAQVLAVMDDLDLDPLGIDSERVCPQGGAIGLGHPWGASGAVLAVRLFSQMVRSSGPRVGLATCAVGGGMGLAMIVERVGP